MTELFYSGAVVAVIATLLVIVQTNVVHALIYLVLSLLAVAVVFLALEHLSSQFSRRSFTPARSWCSFCLW